MLSREFLLQRGYCCGHGCLMCPYEPKHTKQHMDPKLNKLGYYIFKRICKDQEVLRKNKPMNTYGLYIQPKDIQRYISDYSNYGIDYTGDDNIAADDKLEHFNQGFIDGDWKIDPYWDDKDD